MNRIFATALLLLLSATSSADLRIFACESDWASLAQTIGGEHVKTSSATTAFQDPHYIQARPSLIAKVRRADLIVCNGAQLEIGWLPMLMQKANNRDVLPGSSGYFEASSVVERLEATGDLDRARGDIHPEGNPHVQVNPHNVLDIAKVLSERMMLLDPENAATYTANFSRFDERWRKSMLEWERKAAPLKGTRAIIHHKSWTYLADWLGIEVVAHLEPVAGLPPTPAHLSGLVAQFKNGGADFIIRAPYQDARASEWLSERSGIPAVMLPLSVGGTDRAEDFFGLFDDIIDRLLGARAE
ncbi:MAG: zinc ABC transporter solute-binding protein [Gammaproteobacteria bacterium]|nr:zinc ABC transporter solute-binding protein [Gammaproteobacteria bacterium]